MALVLDGDKAMAAAVVMLWLLVDVFFVVDGVDWRDLNLLPEHTPPFFLNNPTLKLACSTDGHCPYKSSVDQERCWGYEHQCTWKQRYSVPSCPGEPSSWIKSKEEQLDLFFSAGDFGYVKKKRQEMDDICSPQKPDDSSLKCTSYLQFCTGRNILIDFANLLTIDEPMRYRTDVLSKGHIGGRCNLNAGKLEREAAHKSPLQSWAPELDNFVTLSDKERDGCDVTVEKPTFLMKLDATVNMYHHFCDFLNLYLAQHMNNSFSRDVNVLIWDTVPYRSNFGVMWKVFTKHPVMDLKKFAGKRVCFRDIVFSFLPRMIFGMYYNMPLVVGCEKSGFFHAFSHHALHRLGVAQKPSTSNKVRVTLMSRETTYRRIRNEEELLQAMHSQPDFQVERVSYTHNMPFIEQLNISQNTDILIGIHGAGLTHLLFLPDWAVVFEIYNCEDDSCYRDLARLRGVKYITWEREDKLTKEDEGHHPTLGAHAKFTNYAFDVGEFLRLMTVARRHVQDDPAWQRVRGSHSRRRDEL